MPAMRYKEQEMKANLVSAASCLVLLLWQHSGWAAVNKTQRSDAPSREFVFIENVGRYFEIVGPLKNISIGIVGKYQCNFYFVTSLKMLH